MTLYPYAYPLAASHTYFHHHATERAKRDKQRHRETQRDTERHRETQRDTERHRETQRDTENAKAPRER